MNRKKAAALYKLFLDNQSRGLSLDDIFGLYCDVTDPLEREKEKKAFIDLITEAKEHGQAGYEIINYIEAKRDTVEEINLDEKGNIKDVKVTEGDPVFDPSGKTDLSPLTGAGNSAFQFGDESTGGIEFLNPERVEIGDEGTLGEPQTSGLTMEQLEDLMSQAVNPDDSSFGETNAPSSMDSNDDGLDDYNNPGGILGM